MRVSDSGFKRALVPQGLHLAICTEVIDLGTQTTEYKAAGKKAEVKSARKVVLRFALPSVVYTDGERIGQPISIGQTLTASLGEKATLRKLLESWRGQAFTAAELRGFNLSKLLGKPCQMQIIHETKGDKTYANIKSVVGVMAGTPIPAFDGDLRSFDLDEFDGDTFESLPDWQKEAIVKSPEYAAATGGSVRSDADDSGIDRDVGHGDASGTVPF